VVKRNKETFYFNPSSSFFSLIVNVYENGSIGLKQEYKSVPKINGREIGNRPATTPLKTISFLVGRRRLNIKWTIHRQIIQHATVL
jgi:hypothetical protein